MNPSKIKIDYFQKKNFIMQCEWWYDPYTVLCSGPAGGRPTGTNERGHSLLYAYIIIVACLAIGVEGTTTNNCSEARPLDYTSRRRWLVPPPVVIALSSQKTKVGPRFNPHLTRDELSLSLSPKEIGRIFINLRKLALLFLPCPWNLLILLFVVVVVPIL